MKFEEFSKLVRAKWEHMVKSAPEIYSSNLSKEEIWATYLEAFPEGSNPIYIERTEHDCNCCKQFIRGIGNAVTVAAGGLDTVWNVPGLASPYKEVAAALHKAVSESGIDTLYRSSEARYGQETSVQHVDGKTINWNHFSGKVSGKYFSQMVGKEQGQHLTNVGVFKRGLEELTLESVDAVLDLIQDNNLYRGQENLKVVQEFRHLKMAYFEAADKDIFLHQNAGNFAALIRNTAIGTLLIDLSEGKELEGAVGAYENKVSGTNYKRPKALITPGMVKTANATVQQLGLQSSLSRRHAVIGDVAITDVIWADRAAQAAMKPSNGLMDILSSTMKAGKVDDKATEMSMDDFLANVVPTAVSMEVLMENRLVPKLVSITAPAEEGAASLFKWDNGFGWTYRGGVADAGMAAEVKSRGGNIDGPFRFTHQWNYDKRNTSLMDLHVLMPGNTANLSDGCHTGYGNNKRVGWNNRNDRASGGIQDVDYTNAAPEGYVPIENISFPDLARMPEGTYVCRIHNWKLRQPTQGGFRAEICVNGVSYFYELDRPMHNEEWVTVAEVTLKNGQFTVKSHLPETGGVKNVEWGLETQTYVPVQTIMKSPNHWGDRKEGNFHTFFMLDGCKNPDPVRGFYNEFLRSELHEHRKVFEVLGNKMVVQPADEQLSGLGFSSTLPAEFQVRVTTDKGTRNYKVKV